MPDGARVMWACHVGTVHDMLFMDTLHLTRLAKRGLAGVPARAHGPPRCASGLLNQYMV